MQLKVIRTNICKKIAILDFDLQSDTVKEINLFNHLQKNPFLNMMAI